MEDYEIIYFTYIKQIYLYVVMHDNNNNKLIIEPHVLFWVSSPILVLFQHIN